MKKKGIGSHQSHRSKTVVWLTPPDIIKALGPFDLDPCSPVDRPWDMAKSHYTELDNGLLLPWHGRVWLNPPYGTKETPPWLNKLCLHGNGIALIFGRTETDMFFRYVWSEADAILFIKGRLHFYNEQGERAKSNSGAPSVLIAYGENNVHSLKESGIKGKFIELEKERNPAL